MPTIAMRLAYNGGAFFGFQSQSDVLTISNALESALRSVGIYAKITGSGRTDRGVHASAQVISLKIPPFWNDLEHLKHELNTKLSPNITIKRIWHVNENFNARFSAKRRGYCYILSSHISPFLTPFALPYELKNPTLIKNALKILIGTHNFRAFSKKDSKDSQIQTPQDFVRTIFHTKLIRYKGLWILSFWGNGFLRSQIRMIVGFLLEIDRGHLSLEDLERQLQGELIYRIPIAPCGLFLTRVDY